MAAPTLLTALTRFPNSDNDGVYCIGIDSDTGNYYPFYLVGDAWYRLAQPIGIPATGNLSHDTVVAEKCLIIAGDQNTNRQINSDGLTMKDDDDADSHVYGSPIANKVNYYKGRLYLGDLTVGFTNYPTRVQASSPPLGIVGLADGDFATGATEIKMTDVKYVRKDDILDVWRGGTEIGSVTVTAKGEDSITVNATGFDIFAADEFWVDDTHDGTRLFRWADNPETGVAVRQYDTFDLTGGLGGRIRMMANVGGVMAIASETAIAYWDDSQLIPVDVGIGCVSDEGYCLHMGILGFVHYSGFYTTTGATTPTYRSAKVEPYFRGATKAGIEKAAVGHKGTSFFITLQDVTLYNDDGSVKTFLNDVGLEWDIQKDDWAVHTNVPATVFETFDFGNRTDRLLYGTDRGFYIPGSGYSSIYGVREFLCPTATYDSDGVNELEIMYRLDLPRQVVTTREEGVAEVRKAVLACDRGSSVEIFVRADDDQDFHACAGQFSKGAKVVTISPKPTDITSDNPGPMVCRALDVSIRGATRSKSRFSRLTLVVEDKAEQYEDRGQDVNGA